MKTIEKILSSSSGKIIVNKAIDENKKHPLIEKKLEEANRILKKVGLPKGW